ncbi:MAG: serine hydrolase [Bacillales bacterium]|nr:serine hydrolase [Bacillales bacterium]
MKTMLLNLFIFFSFLFTSSNISYISENIYVRSYCLLDGNTNEVISCKNMDQRQSVASISKIMTAIISIEEMRLFDVIEVKEEVIKNAIGSSLYLESGIEVSIIDLVYGLLLRSGNDAAHLLGDYLGPTIPKFVEKMNNKAKELNLNDTYFSNPSGLDLFDEGNKSTAYDMCLLMSYCLNNEVFREIINTKYYKSTVKGYWKNKNKLLFDYSYCIGGKTGFTKKARRTLITASEKDGDLLILCTFDCGSDFLFHKKAYSQIFDNTTYFCFVNKGYTFIDNKTLYCKRNYGIRIDNEDISKIYILISFSYKHNKFEVSIFKENKVIKKLSLDDVYIVHNID